MSTIRLRTHKVDRIHAALAAALNRRDQPLADQDRRFNPRLRQF
jgi:hypothetical protein